MNILVLDDDDSRHRAFTGHLIGHNVTTTHTYFEAVRELDRDDIVWDVLFLDHDLNDHKLKYRSIRPGIYGDDKLTGFDVAVFIVSTEQRKRPKKVIIHSTNDDMAEAMTDFLKENAIKVLRWPFSALAKDFPSDELRE